MIQGILTILMILTVTVALSSCSNGRSGDLGPQDPSADIGDEWLWNQSGAAFVAGLDDWVRQLGTEAVVKKLQHLQKQRTHSWDRLRCELALRRLTYSGYYQRLDQYFEQYAKYLDEHYPDRDEFLTRYFNQRHHVFAALIWHVGKPMHSGELEMMLWPPNLSVPERQKAARGYFMEWMLRAEGRFDRLMVMYAGTSLLGYIPPLPQGQGETQTREEAWQDLAYMLASMASAGLRAEMIGWPAKDFLLQGPANERYRIQAVADAVLAGGNTSPALMDFLRANRDKLDDRHREALKTTIGGDQRPIYDHLLDP